MADTKSVIVYGAGGSGRGAAEVLAKHGQQVFLYNDTECKIEDGLAQALAAHGTVNVDTVFICNQKVYTFIE